MHSVPQGSNAQVCHVIFDLGCPTALETGHGYLDDLDIADCGRYRDGDTCGRTSCSQMTRMLSTRILDRFAATAVLEYHYREKLMDNPSARVPKVVISVTMKGLPNYSGRNR
jgi:hypothetical protein